MHPDIQMRRDIVDGLHQRSRLATAEFYRLIDRCLLYTSDAADE